MNKCFHDSCKGFQLFWTTGASHSRVGSKYNTCVQRSKPMCVYYGLNQSEAVQGHDAMYWAPTSNDGKTGCG